MKNRLRQNTIVLQLLRFHFWGALLLCAFLSFLYFTLNSPLQCLFASLENIGGFSFIGVLDIQISVSFIVVSIVTIFAQKNVTIYWEDIMQYKLIRPKYTNFNAMASYIFVTLIASILLILCGSAYIYVTFFISILLIMMLSLKMLAAFFSDDLIRQELENLYRVEKSERATSKEARIHYREHKRKLIQYTLQAIDANEIDTVCTNMKFLYSFEEYDDTVYLVQKMLSDNKVYLLSRVAKVCSDIFSSPDRIREYDGICRRILQECPASSHGYIKSIYKSMGEHVTENAPEALPNLRTIIDDFCSYSISSGCEELASSVQSVFQKQILEA